VPLNRVTPQTTGPVLLYDGECGLCNRIMRLLLRLDREERLRFATLQGRAGQAYLSAHALPAADFDSLVLVPDWTRREQREFLLRTDGVIAALRGCGGLGRGLAAALAVLPAAGRDAGYRLAARWRYRIFGAWRPRPLARPEWRARFIE
jgi:predicted DCC family thiol-disulfide oxidoreductase YuxK